MPKLQNVCNIKLMILLRFVLLMILYYLISKRSMYNFDSSEFEMNSFIVQPFVKWQKVETSVLTPNSDAL